MYSASTQYEDHRRRRRSIALALAVAIHLALILIVPNYIPPARKVPREPATFTLTPDQPAESARAPKVTEKKRDAGGGAKQTPKSEKPSPPVPTPPTEADPPPSPFLTMSKDEFAAADISKIQGPSGGGTAGTGAGRGRGATYGPGEGPGGAQLYNADWYRRPSDAELAYFMPPKGPRTGWGMVACQTIADFHVDNCRVIGESPLGSGFGNAVRRAAWQFRVRPPRMDDRPMIGAWVRIRIEYTEGVPRS